MTNFSGMTGSSCASACNPESCIISNKPICSHPLMGGLQKPLKTPDALVRYAEACKAIGVKNVHEAAE